MFFLFEPIKIRAHNLPKTVHYFIIFIRKVTRYLFLIWHSLIQCLSKFIRFIKQPRHDSMFIYSNVRTRLIMIHLTSIKKWFIGIRFYSIKPKQHHLGNHNRSIQCLYKVYPVHPMPIQAWSYKDSIDVL